MSPAGRTARATEVIVAVPQTGPDEQHDRVAAFRRLHASGCFVMPNPWDVGSARALAALGSQALATTSAGFAWTLGRADDDVSLEQTLDHLRAVVDAVDVPVNADFSGAFAVDPDQVGAQRPPRCRDGGGGAVRRGLHGGRGAPAPRPRAWPSNVSSRRGRPSTTAARASC